MSDPVPLDQCVERQLARGRYQSYGGLVEEALRLLQERKAEKDRIAEKLQLAAERCIRGEPGIPFDAEDVILRGGQRLSARDSTA